MINIVSALVSFTGSSYILFSSGDWYGALGWFIVGLHQLGEFVGNTNEN